MTTLKSLFDIYKIKKALVKVDEKVEIIILERGKSFSLNDWVNLILGVKRTFNKEVNFLLKKDLINNNHELDKFLLIEGSYYE